MDEIQIIRSRRGTIAVCVQPDGSVQVKAPKEMRIQQIKAFVSQHQDWIEKKKKLVEEQKEMRKTFEKKFIRGEKFLYLGREYALDIVAAPGKMRSKAYLIADTLTVEIGTARERSPRELTDEIEAAVRKWYQEEARKYFEKRTMYYAGTMGVSFGQIRLKEQKTRWGSCSSKGNLNFNWKLIMAPPEILDYVVVHELCHLREMNHSRYFWQEVEKVLPDYRERRYWLKRHGEELCIKRAEA